MNPENLYEEYQQLLEENQLLRNLVASLEATLKAAGVPLVEAGATKYIESKPAIIPTQALEKSYSNLAQLPIPTLISPALAGKTVATFLNTIKPRIPETVVVSVMTKSADSIANPQYRSNRMQPIESLVDKEIDVQQQETSGPKCVLIDRKVVWYGSIDVLGNQSNDASFIRLRNCMSVLEGNF